MDRHAAKVKEMEVQHATQLKEHQAQYQKTHEQQAKDMAAFNKQHTSIVQDLSQKLQ